MSEVRDLQEGIEEILGQAIASLADYASQFYADDPDDSSYNKLEPIILTMLQQVLWEMQQLLKPGGKDRSLEDLREDVNTLYMGLLIASQQIRGEK